MTIKFNSLYQSW